MLRTFQEKFGPGLLFAASAVGVSHLVQSTQGGAIYGLTMIGIIVGVCLVKYPIFLFSAHYTGATGETLLDGYGRLGKWILLLVFVIHVLELPFAISGVSLVTAGIIKSVVDIALADTIVSVLLIFVSLSILAMGRYTLLENLSKIFVFMFLVCILLAGLMSLIEWDISTLNPGGSIDFNRDSVLFLVAIAGWMPTGVAGALGVSLWVYAKGRKNGKPLTLKETIFDFNFGYVIVIVVACCFSIIGSYIFYSSDMVLEQESAAFFTQLISLFISALGTWAYYFVVVGSIVVMFSSLLILVDLLPRISSTSLIRLMPDRFTEDDQTRLYLYFIVYEMITVLAIFVFLFDSFITFINLVTTIGFLAAPVIAFLNYKIIFSSLVPVASQPSTGLKVWGLGSIAVLSAVTLVYLLGLLVE